MDLPTCPSCGQSVLDDDAQDCPFCGAAMDGSSGGKTSAPTSDAAAAEPKKKKPARKSDPDNDDPFAIAQTPSTQKVLSCAPKPMKGRLHRVVCPMCDTQGFIPKGAVGRQVRCANKQCLVPVFEAEGKEKDKTPRAPARVSDSESAQKKKAVKAPSQKNPMIMYGVVGAVLLALTLGLVAYLNKPPIDKLGPANISMPEYVEDEEPATVPSGEVETPVVVDYRSKATALVDDMINHARETSGNRDKPLCRRQTGDAFLRLGLNAKADAEFAQMDKISSGAGRDTTFYRIAPLMTNYWQMVSAGDSAAAAKRLDEAKQLADGIPKSGLLAVEATVNLASALAQSGDSTAAQALIESKQPDPTVALQLDAVRHGAWGASTFALADSGQKSVPPGTVFAWHEPLISAVALHLAARADWDAAIAWAKAQKETRTISDSLAIIADRMMTTDAASEIQQKVIAAAEASGPETALRTVAVLSQKANPALWEKAKRLRSALPAEKSTAPKTIEEIMTSASPDFAKNQLTAEALADFAIAAAGNGDASAATEAVQSIYQTLVSQIAPTAELRSASGELEKREDDVKARVAKELSLTPGSQEIRARFLSYRRGVDRQAAAAEKRRMVMLQSLCRVIRGGGLSAVKTALAAENGMLKQEVCVDDLKGMLSVAAASTGESFAEINSEGADLRVPIARVDPLPETKIVKALVAAWAEFLSSKSSSAATKLEQVVGLAGVRSANATYMTELASLKATSATDQFDAIGKFKDQRWREVFLELSTRILTERGMMEDVQAAVSSVAKTPTQRVAALHGIVSGAVTLSNSQPASE